MCEVNALERCCRFAVECCGSVQIGLWSGFSGDEHSKGVPPQRGARLNSPRSSSAIKESRLLDAEREDSSELFVTGFEEVELPLNIVAVKIKGEECFALPLKYCSFVFPSVLLTVQRSTTTTLLVLISMNSDSEAGDELLDELESNTTRSKKGDRASHGGYKLRNVLKLPRATTYTTQSLYGALIISHVCNVLIDSLYLQSKSLAAMLTWNRSTREVCQFCVLIRV